MNSTLLVIINVINMDDTGPMFTMSEYIFNVSENASEKELNENTYDNPTYTKLIKENEHSTLPDYENNIFPAENQDYEVPYDDMQ